MENDMVELIEPQLQWLPGVALAALVLALPILIARRKPVRIPIRRDRRDS
jgi:hypothetical protein